jgi:hypothetical protein
MIVDYITKHQCYTKPTIISVEHLMLHSVGVAQPSAPVIYKQWDKPDISVCCHAFVEPAEVYQILPFNYKANHCGGAPNNDAIAVEMTEPNTIKYIPNAGAKFIDLAPAATKEHVLATYHRAANLFADLCIQYDLDPLQDILSHAEAAKMGIASAHADPDHLLTHCGLSMDKFREEVDRLIEEKLREIVKQEIAKADPVIKDLDDVPEYWQSEAKELLRCGAIDGGTKDKQDDVNLKRSVLQAAIIAKRYADR